MALSDLTEDSVLAAVNEFDRLGSAAFLSKYGFSPARQYHLVVNGTSYPSKAIAGAAHGYLGNNSMPMRARQFSGGDNTVAAKLRSLGFEVAGETVRNPKWLRDELILVLDLYLRNPQSPPGRASRELAALSAELNQLNAVLGRHGGEQFRNAAGVYMKLMNFRRFDPSFTSVGKSGLSHGAKEDEAVWDEFASDPRRLSDIASAIRSALASGITGVPDDGVDDEEQAEEGRILTALHYRRERSRKLVKARKEKAIRETGELPLLDG